MQKEKQVPRFPGFPYSFSHLGLVDMVVARKWQISSGLLERKAIIDRRMGETGNRPISPIPSSASQDEQLGKEEQDQRLEIKEQRKK